MVSARKYLMLLLLFPLFLSAQVMISPIGVGSPFFNLDQLINVQLNNASNDAVEGILQVQMEDNASRTIFQLQSLPMKLKAGQVLTARQINWENGLRFGKEDLAQLLAMGNRLPQGQYIYCYRFINQQTGRSIGNFCQESSFSTFQLPRLVYPNNLEKINTKHPILSWHPPMPLLGNELNYSLRLVELESGQSTTKAINSNFPLLERHNLKSLSIPYPLAGIPLKEGKAYVWQVTAYWQDVKMGDTEVWQFSVKKKELTKIVEQPKSYRMVKRKMAGSFYVFSKQLLFAYDNRNDEAYLNYKIYPKGKRNQPLKNLPAIELRTGINQLALDTRKELKLEKNQPYVLEITNQLGYQYFLGFKYSRKK